MNDDRYLGADDTHIRELALKLIAGNAEGGKVDFKRQLPFTSAKDKVEFCKDLSAIANSDDHRLGGHGYIVFGAEPGNLLGGLTAWEPGKADSFSASLNDIAKNYLAPVPNFHFVPFEDEQRGQWAILVVPPSSSQPHIFIKEFESTPAKHEWFVRINDTTERAGALDYARVMAKKVTLATSPLFTELQRAQLRIEALERGQLNAQDLLVAVGGKPAATGEVPTQKSPSAIIRHRLRRPDHDVEDALTGEALRVWAAMSESSPKNPLTWPRTSKDATEQLEYLEDQTREFARCLMDIVRLDPELDTVRAVSRSFKLIARQPQAWETHWQNAECLRLYPVVLCLHAVAAMSVFRESGKVLRALLDLKLSVNRGDASIPLIACLRRVEAASDLFREVQDKNYHLPVAERLRTVLPTWLSAAAPGCRPEATFFVAEFLLALEYTVSFNLHSLPIPAPGSFLYGYEAVSAISESLSSRSDVYRDLFGNENAIEVKLKAFDEHVHRVVAPGSMGGGFQGGAMAAWIGEPIQDG